MGVCQVVSMLDHVSIWQPDILQKCAFAMSKQLTHLFLQHI